MNQKCESGDILYSVKAGVTFGGSELGRVRSIQLLFQSLSALQWLCGSHCVGTESATPIQAVNADASAATTGGLGCNPGQENNVTRLLRTSAALTHRGSVRARRLKKTEQNLRNDGQPTVFYLFV